ncbi:MAG: hypothetical protein U0529_14390 [Thermoanaerobaculia bacterium]
MKHALMSLLILALSGCYPFPERQQPLAKAVEGLDGLEPRQLRYCRCAGDREAEALPTQLWPEIKSRLLALTPAPEAVPGPWDLQGRLIVTFPDASDLYIDFDTWSQRFGDRVFVTVYWLPRKGRYEVGKGDAFYTWYRSTTAAEQLQQQARDSDSPLPQPSAGVPSNP